jgi:two-component system LytT family response regulator
MVPKRILIVDDEVAACNMLRMLLRRYMPVAHEIRAEQNPVSALQVLDSYKPDLVMLDIEMPGMTGFDFLNRAGSCEFDVIFTTAFDQYAIKAIRFSALDYLLKPLDIVELQNALNRFVIRNTAKQVPEQQQRLLNNLIENVQKDETEEFRLAISTVDGVFFYLPSEIMRCEGENNYTTFYLVHGKPLIASRTLKEYEGILSDYGDFQKGQSFVSSVKFEVLNPTEKLRLSMIRASHFSFFQLLVVFGTFLSLTANGPGFAVVLSFLVRVKHVYKNNHCKYNHPMLPAR